MSFCFWDLACISHIHTVSVIHWKPALYAVAFTHRRVSQHAESGFKGISAYKDVE